MASSAPATEASIGRRGQGRLRTRLAARLITLDGTSNTVLLDLSLTGARIQSPRCGARIGQEALLAWANFEAFGTVVWNSGSQCGLVFDEPIGQEALLATRQAALLPSDKELERIRLREWVAGERRI